MFNKIIDNINYIPNCIICGKEMRIYFSGFVKIPFKAKEFCYIKTYVEDNKILSINNKYPLKIDISSNEIIYGNELLKTLLSSHLDFYKKCPTCLFQINFNIFKNKNDKFLSSSTLLREEVSYYLKNKSRLHIFNHYNKKYAYCVGNHLSDVHLSGDQSKVTYIYVNNKYLNCGNINLSKFNNFKKLNNYINTLLAFG